MRGQGILHFTAPKVEVRQVYRQISSVEAVEAYKVCITKQILIIHEYKVYVTKHMKLHLLLSISGAHCSELEYP